MGGMQGAGPGVASTITPQEAASRGRWWRLVNGQTHYDFVGRSSLWLRVSIGLFLICALGLAVRGLNFGIDFTGGNVFIVSGATAEFSAEQISDNLQQLGVAESVVQIVSDDTGRGVQVTTPALDRIGGEQEQRIVGRLAEITGADAAGIDVNAVGPRWGQQVSRQALRGLLVFLVLVVAYISFRFELRMAIAALVTLLHDLFVTIGIYAIVGFEVTPASVIALLTILGYSLYDTVVVFDRVREDTVRLSSMSSETYGQVANRALNEVLVRSLSTSLCTLLPIGSLLFIGASLLGADTLRHLALALFIGIAVGTYSSVFVATPFLVWLKEREPRWAELKEKVHARTAAPAAVAAGASGSPGSSPSPDAPATTPSADRPARSRTRGPARQGAPKRGRRRR